MRIFVYFGKFRRKNSAVVHVHIKESVSEKRGRDVFVIFEKLNKAVFVLETAHLRDFFYGIIRVYKQRLYVFQPLFYYARLYVHPEFPFVYPRNVVRTVSEAACHGGGG